MPQIVQVNVTQQIAPTPSLLQKTGAFVSQGATVTSPGTLTILTQLSDLTPVLRGAHTLSALTWASGLVTATTTAPHGFTTGDTIEVTIVGSTPTGYNGTYLATVTGASTFTYARTNPGSNTVLGSYTVEDVSELVAMVTTFFAQGSSVAVFVLELGAGNASDGALALRTYLTANPGEIYAMLVPRYWDGNSDFLALIADYEATTAKTYFWVTTNLQNYLQYVVQMKDVVALVEAPQQHPFLQNVVTSMDFEGDMIAISATVATAQSGAGSYNINNVLTAVGGAGTEPTFTITHLQVTSAVVNAGGGSGSPDGPVTITGTSAGTPFQATGTISSGVLTGPLVVTVPGDYTVRPSSLTSEPVTGGSLVGATVTIKTGPLTVVVTTPGAMSTLADNPVATTVSPSTGTGATLNITWDMIAPYGTVTIGTTTAHGVNVGDWFQLAGFTPAGYNTWYQAIAGTSGSTVVAYLNVNPGTATVLGTLLGSTTTGAAPPSVEFSLAAPFWNALHYSPSTTNKVAPFAFQYVFGVTPWVQKGNNALLTLLKNASIDVIGTGAEGGISNTAIFWGTTMDARDFTYWYSVDWAQITAAQNLANAIINGSNNPINPLYYDQNGIDRLQDVVVGTMQTAVAVGLANGIPARSKMDGPAFVDALENGVFDGKLVVNAVPFLDYLRVNPNDYKLGRYAGLSVQYIPNRGFVSVVFNINVTDFIVQ